MTSRERVRKALRHEPTDRPPIDLGSTTVTSIQASAYHRLRNALGLAKKTVKVNEPFQILAEVENDVREKLGVDTYGIWGKGTLLGFRNENWKPWTLQDGTPVLIGGDFEYTLDANGDILAHPGGDRSARPSARLPKGGYYFDAIVRQQPIDEDHLDPQEWAEQFGVFSDADLKYFQQLADDLYRNTDYSLVGNFWGGGLGDVALVPGPWLKNPKGVRDPELWYEFLVTHTDYIRAIFEMHTEVALKNLALYRDAVGDKIDVVIMSGTDFGSQRALLISPDLFRALWKPFYKRLNDWVHKNTKWKIFFHSCGSVSTILDDFVEAGVDILNPVQCSAMGMEAETLKARYGDKLVFWGGGVDTQHVLPFGTADEVRQQVRERVRILGAGGGFVFNTIHNIQGPTPVENIVAMYDEVRASAKSPPRARRGA